MALQKKVNKLQVEHVSEEEVDQVSANHACLDDAEWTPPAVYRRPTPTPLARAPPLSPCRATLLPRVRTVRRCLCAQLFYALEVKEQQLEQAMQDKESLEQEVLTARQLSARGGGGAAQDRGPRP